MAPTGSPKEENTSSRETSEKATPYSIIYGIDSQVELQRYEQYVRFCAENKINFPIPNGVVDHASILFKIFFERATNEVVIYTGELYEGIFDVKNDLIDSAVAFLNDHPMARLKIAYEHLVPKETILDRKFISTIIRNEKIQSQIEIWNASNVNKKEHFSVMDKSAYRYETDCKRRTK
jgi:hypothetical protein